MQRYIVFFWWFQDGKRIPRVHEFESDYGEGKDLLNIEAGLSASAQIAQEFSLNVEDVSIKMITIIEKR